MKIIFKSLFHLIALLPFWALYLLSDFLFLILYRLTRYRRKVVMANLKNSFPEKNDKELALIEKKFYRHLSDITLESIKAISMSRAVLQRHVKIADTEGYRHYIAHKKAAIMMTGHFGNWEWAGLAIGLATNRPLEVVYLKQGNLAMNDIMLGIRSKFGNRLAKMSQVYIHQVKQKQDALVSCILGDQTPQKHRIGYWTTFLNQDTPFFGGQEKMARRLGLNVYFGNTIRVKRGYYRIEIALITDAPATEPGHYITETYAQMADRAIRHQPESWLWSHRRWKHTKPSE